ncbi:MAG: carboxypeptidase-like regulatory domain-containing protein, partial [Acidobacteria bacterium]|nr:carboxypeptidase-like regulatory domain-containing protein [Acidobacteriota bacterium]
MLAQTTLGSAAVSGTVRDVSDASVPDCKVVLVETGRGLSRETVTNENGLFLFPTVSAGLYSLTVSKAAFETYQLNDVRVDVGQRATLNVVLKVGAVSSVVSVSAGARVLLETDSNAVGTVVDSGRVESLPLNGRNFLQLSMLAGGANMPAGNSDNIGSQIGHSGRSVILAGNMPQTTGYIIDGIATRGGRLGESSLNLSVAAIDQFKVQQSFFMPDQGPNPALVNVTTKGGGNQFHGQAFEYVRNERFDARNFFAKAPEHLKRNQFGGALGGPIRKDKIWFYGFYEGLRQLQAFSSSAYTPTAGMFRGDLSATGRPIYDPATYSAGTSTRQPFPDNIIPANRINPVSTNLLKYYLPGSSLAQRPANLFGNPRNTLNDDQWGVRLDASLTTGQTLYGQFIHENSPANQPGLFPLSGALFPNTSDLIMAQHTWMISPRFINTARVGFNRSVALNGNEGAPLGDLLGTVGITNVIDPRGISGIGIQGYAGFGHAAGDLGNIDNNYQLDEGINYVRGNHNFQFGGSIRYRRTWQQNANASSVGSLTFQPVLTAQLTINAQRQTVPQANTGDAFADFLLGYPTSGTVNGLPRLPYRFTQYMPYFADTWKLTRSLTLNYGVSWFLATVPEPRGWARQWPHSLDPATGLLQYAALGQVDPRILSFDGNNLAPRLGLAWSPSFLPHTVIRAGSGFYYADSGLIEMQFAMVAPPFSSPFTITQPQTNPAPLYQLGKNIFPTFPSRPLDANFAAGLPNGTTAFLINPDGRTPYTGQWNLSIQHTFSNNDLLQADYIGSSSHRVQERYQANQCRPGADLYCSPSTVPWSRYASLLTSDFSGNTSYEGLVTRYEHRTAGGLNLRFEYTFAKALIDTGWEGGGNQSQIASCRSCDKAPASFNVKHRAVVSTIYDLPFGRGRPYGRNMSRALDLVAGGWTVTGITAFATGTPVALIAANTTASQNVTPRPNRVCSGNNSDLLGNLRNNGFVAFDTACFATPGVGYFGNSSRNPITGPGVNNWDIGFQKFFSLR